MKKIMFLLLFIICGLAASAQQKKGDFQLQGQLSYNSITVSGTTTSYGLVQVAGSYFFTDQIEAGIAPLLMLNKDFSMNQTQFFANYSFLTSDAKFVPYAGAHIQLSALKVQSVDPLTGNSTSTTKTSVGFGFRAGIRYFLTENVNIDVGPRISFGDQSSFIFAAGVGVIIGKH